MFAEKYLAKNKVSAKIQKEPHPELGIIVVIPCYREPEMIAALVSLSACSLPHSYVEVIVLINHSEAAAEEIKIQNEHTRREADEWIAGNSKEGMQYFTVGPVEFRKKWAGAGMARKAGMDEAIVRFNRLNRPSGIIVSLDADTLVEENYLVEIEKYFSRHPFAAGATLSFEHRKEGLNEKHLEGIRLYEQYMQYYKRAMGYAGYPWPMFTVGSAFAATAGSYVKRGGMNRRQAGEDFYFLQNLVQVGPVGEIVSTTVHPSARLSDRVPFGTGPVLQKWMQGAEDLHLTYNFEAYVHLKSFFDKVDLLFQLPDEDYQKLLNELPQPVASFLIADNFLNELSDLNRNCASLNSFRLRFFQKFNAFKILKFLNFTHETFYNKADLNGQIRLLIESELNTAP